MLRINLEGALRAWGIIMKSYDVFHLRLSISAREPKVDSRWQCPACLAIVHLTEKGSLAYGHRSIRSWLQAHQMSRWSFCSFTSTKQTPRAVFIRQPAMVRRLPISQGNIVPRSWAVSRCICLISCSPPVLLPSAPFKHLSHLRSVLWRMAAHPMNTPQTIWLRGSAHHVWQAYWTWQCRYWSTRRTAQSPHRS